MNIWEHFDKEERYIPFSDGQEETNAYLRWLDMFLLAAIELKEDENAEVLRKELREASVLLGTRVEASKEREVSALNGIGITNIAAQYGLYDFSFFCLLMAVAVEMDAHYLMAYKELSDYSSDYLTFALAEDIFSEYAEPEELPGIRQYRNIIEKCPLFNIIPSNDGEGSLLDGITINRQLASIIKGDYEIESGLNEIISERVAIGSEDEGAIHKEDIQKLQTFLNANEHAGNIVHIRGKKGSGRKNLVLRALDKARIVIIVSVDRLIMVTPEKVRSYTKEILVRSTTLGRDLIIVCEDKENLPFLKGFLRTAIPETDRLFIITDEKVYLDDVLSGYRSFTVDIGIPSALERQLIWKKKFEEIDVDKDVDIEELSGKYRLYPGVISGCVSQAKARCDAEGKTKVTKKMLADAILDNTTTALDALCDRIPLKFTWDDLVIDDRQKLIMETLCSRVKNRSIVDEEWGFNDKITYGRGVSLILFGAPGTGKTMAAQVMAKEIGMALYRVDLSQLVDKYIGETEKNIGKIFDAASDGNVILFFDEADALFSKRTDVTSSNDKHANTEVAFLLQKIEQHEGVTFLATNRFNDFDAAFIRRINYAVRIERPDAATRLKLYEKILPKKTPKADDINLKYYADNFEISGSEIKEVLYSAAFMAAADNKCLSNKHILQALKLQQEKTGKIVSGAEISRFIM